MQYKPPLYPFITHRKCTESYYTEIPATKAILDQMYRGEEPLEAQNFVNVNAQG